MNKLFHRYHCYDSDNNKLTKRFEVDQIPVQLPDHTEWVRGHGPYSAEALFNVIAGAKKKFCGVPKSAAQKAKMREAKLGVKKSPEHIRAMCLAQQRRHHGPNANNRSNLE